MKKLLMAATMVLVTVSALIFSCQKEVNSTKSAKNNTAPHLKIYLTDAPASYDAVLIDVQNVQINFKTDSTSGWQTVSGVVPGVYNLLDLVNGNTVLLASSDIPVGTISQVRLILGSNNSVVAGADTFELTTPSAQQSGLKLNVHQQVDSGFVYDLVIDFDAARSIVKAGNSGKYILKPVLRASFQVNNSGPLTGKISGVAVPDSFTTAVYAIHGVDTATTFTDSAGNYLISNLNPNTYDLRFVPGNSTFHDTTRSGIIVTAGNTTVVDTMRLHQ